MNLRPRFLLLTGLFFLLVAVPSWLVVRGMAERIVERWAVHVAEKQVLYDKSRTLQPILREVALSRQMAQSVPLREWARQPDDPALARRALDEIEGFRKNFQDQSYFVVLHRNGRYYHNNAHNEFAGREFRYVLDPRAAKDAWYFDLVRQRRDLHINVNPDLDLGITKLWIDVLIRDGEEILGMAGTGMDLTHFIATVVEDNVPGVANLFVDRNGAIQLHRNQRMIDFGSVSKALPQQKTLRLLFDRTQDANAVLTAMERLAASGDKVSTQFVQVGGKRHLAGIAYLPEIEWFEITLMDLDVVLPVSQFTGLMGIYGLTLVGLLLMFHLALRRYVIRPLDRLGLAITALEAGQAAPPIQGRSGSTEIDRLMQRFRGMAEHVTEARRDLEAKVRERTAALERLTLVDPLTELLNRRGMLSRFEEEMHRSQREGRPLGILWIDIDHFKDINDLNGHAVGDQAIQAIAGVIQRSVRPYDAVSRWGGDEFLVLLPQISEAALNDLGARLCAEVEACDEVRTASGDALAFTVSIGGHLQRPGETLADMLHHGDQALYRAKAGQRNRYVASH
jgi:diguanylate cyclase (GGDEF)-like protein